MYASVCTSYCKHFLNNNSHIVKILKMYICFSAASQSSSQRKWVTDMETLCSQSEAWGLSIWMALSCFQSDPRRTPQTTYNDCSIPYSSPVIRDTHHCLLRLALQWNAFCYLVNILELRLPSESLKAKGNPSNWYWNVSSVAARSKYINKGIAVINSRSKIGVKSQALAGNNHVAISGPTH